MKSILLTTTAIVAFAGAAAADGHTSINHALSGTLGFNDTVATTDDNENGFYWEGNLKTTATATLDNGLTAGAYFEITVAGDDTAINNDGGQDLASSDFLLSLTSDAAGLYYGDTSRAAQKHWASAGDMEADGFSTGSKSAVLRGDVKFGGVDTSVSYLIDDSAADSGDALQQLSVGAAADFGMVSISLGYQEATALGDTDEDFNADKILAASGTASVGGATVTVAYAKNSTDDQRSAGIKVAYPFGPVTATAYYVDENGGADDGEANIGLNVAYADGPISATVDWQNDQGTSKWSVNGSYDVGNGVSVFAGLENQNEGDDDDYHVGGSMDLGGGASLLVTYAMDGDGDQEDEIGSGDRQEGTTVELSFAF